MNKIIHGDSLEVLKTLESESVDCMITSPPYWALRDYGVAGQLGLEPAFQEYITKLCDIFDEVKRVLKKEGTCWVNLGDTYNGAKAGKTDDKVSDKVKDANKKLKKTKQNSKQLDITFKSRKRYCCQCGRYFDAQPHQYFCGASCSGVDNTPRIKKGILQDKTLIQIPSRFAIEMSNRGWILRNEIIWHKPNCMPSSVTDRFTVDFEKVFFFVKSKKYWFETQYDPYAPASDARYRQALRAGKSYVTKEPYKNNTPYSGKYKRGTGSVASRGDDGDGLVVGGSNPNGRNRRTVWSINTKPLKDAHFATFPEALIEPMIKAGCPVTGIVLDIFMGGGTTAVVAKKLGRNYLGIELNPSYIKIAEKRIAGVTSPLF